MYIIYFIGIFGPNTGILCDGVCKFISGCIGF